MRHATSTLVLIFFTYTHLSATAQQLANACKIFLDKPVFTTQTTQSSQVTKDSFRLLQCAVSWKNSSEAQSAGVDITVPIYDLPVPISANWDNTKVEQWKTQNCSAEERNSQANLKYHSAVYAVEPVSAKTGLECFDRAFKAEADIAAGAALRCTLTETPAAYVFEARWRRTAGETANPPKVQTFTAINTTCPNLNDLAANTAISEGGVPLLCLVGDRAAAFSLTTDRGGCSASASVRLPKLKIPDTLQLSAPLFLSGQEIEVPANATIVTNGFPLSIRADKLTLLGQARIQSFEPSAPQSMKPGRSAGPITISAGEVGGQGGVAILNAGEPGGAGSPGYQGPQGPQGSPGRGRTTNWKKNCPIPFVCDLIPSGCEGGDNGGTGKQGGTGYAGIAGMPGGSAGEVILDLPYDGRKLFSIVTNARLDGQPKVCSGLTCGGNGGPGGVGGPGGPGGPGGEGAPGTVYCGGTNTGPQGGQGGTGPQGPNGPDGQNVGVKG